MSQAPVVALSRFRADVARGLARRGERLLEARDLPEQVQKLDPLETYYIIKELGVDNAGPILAHATPEQLQACVDLDCWAGDEPAGEDLAAWLAPFAAEGPEALCAVFNKLDEELRVWFLADQLNIYDVRAEEGPADGDDRPRLTTPDTYFIVEAKHADEDALNPVVLVDALYRDDLEEAFRLLTAARWELNAPLVEEAHRFRSARLGDLGFVSRDVALGLFAPFDAKRRTPLRAATVTPMTLPAVYAASLDERCLLVRGLARITDEETLARVEQELVHVINCAVVAYGHSPRDLQHAAEVAERVRDTVSLGIEAALSPDAPLEFPDGEQAAEGAANVLRTWYIKELFRHGHTQVLALQRDAKALLDDPVVASFVTRVLNDNEAHAAELLDALFLTALASPTPLWGGFDPAQPRRQRAFAAQRHLRDAETRLNRLAEALT